MRETYCLSSEFHVSLVIVFPIYRDHYIGHDQFILPFYLLTEIQIIKFLTFSKVYRKNLVLPVDFKVVMNTQIVT